MRILSIIPAFLLALTTFVDAAPPTDTSCHSISCARQSVSGRGSEGDTPVQQIINIFDEATTQLTPLSGQLSSAVGSGSSDEETIAGIVSQINSVLGPAVSQLQAVPQVNLQGDDIERVGDAISNLFNPTIDVLNNLVTYAATNLPSGLDPIGGIVNDVNGTFRVLIRYVVRILVILPRDVEVLLQDVSTLLGIL